MVSRDPCDMAKAGSAPRGAKRKEMTDINISSVLAGMPALGCCSGLEKLGTAEARDRAPEVKRPDNVTAGRHCQTPACVLARPKVEREQTGGRSPFNSQTTPNLADTGRPQQRCRSVSWRIAPRAAI